MNVMNSNNIDNRLQPKRDTSSKKSGIKMGQEKINVINLKTAAREGDKSSLETAHIDMVGSTTGSSSGVEGKKMKRKRKSPLVPWKKPEGMPKRPLSAYNLFFKARRKQIMVTASESKESLLDESKQSSRKSSKKKSGVGFANLARTIGTEWRALPTEKKAPYVSLAAGDKDRYDREMKVWRAKEKELKSMRESEPATNTQSFDWPTFASISAARSGFDEDPHSMRNAARDTPLSLAGRVGAGSQSASMLPLQDHESRGAFRSSIYRNYNRHPYSMDAPSNQPSNLMLQQQQQQQQQQDTSAYSSASLNILDKGQLRSLNNSVAKDNLEQNFPYDVTRMGSSSSAQATRSFQTNPFLDSRSINRDATKPMPWSNQRSALNMDNMMSTSIDLEPLPLPENHQQPTQEKIFQRASSWPGQLGLQQMHGKDQHQQRTTIASDEQYLRRLSTGGAPLFSTGWGQNNSWNTNALDATDPIALPYGSGNVNQESSRKRSSQEGGNNPSEETKSRNIDARSFSSSSNNPNQDLYRFFNDGQN